MPFAAFTSPHSISIALPHWLAGGPGGPGGVGGGGGGGGGGGPGGGGRGGGPGGGPPHPNGIIAAPQSGTRDVVWVAMPGCDMASVVEGVPLYFQVQHGSPSSSPFV